MLKAILVFLLMIWIGGLLMRWVLPLILVRWMRRFQEQIQSQGEFRKEQARTKSKESNPPIKGDYIDYEEIP
jgi:hypothetical protein